LTYVTEKVSLNKPKIYYRKNMYYRVEESQQRGLRPPGKTGVDEKRTGAARKGRRGQRA